MKLQTRHNAELPRQVYRAGRRKPRHRNDASWTDAPARDEVEREDPFALIPDPVSLADRKYYDEDDDG